MKAKNLLLIPAMLLITLLAAEAQKPSFVRHSIKDIVPFGNKLPAPDLTKYQGRPAPAVVNRDLNAALRKSMMLSDPNTTKKSFDLYRQQLLNMRKLQQASLSANAAPLALKESNKTSAHTDFHLTRDINALKESNPINAKYEYPSADSYAILDDVIYFAADDGIHGNELWRSDGTEKGSYMVKDIEPGTGSGILAGYINDITAANGKLYFSANTSVYGEEPWVSDGTEDGTQLLMDIQPGTAWGDPREFVAVGNEVYFAASGAFFYWDALWKTDGTTAGTTLVRDFGALGTGYNIVGPTASNGLLFFTLYDFNYGQEPWRSDGTDAGTYLLKDIGPFEYSSQPTQMTSYNNKLYFSADDGTGRKLWLTDGTEAGTTYAPYNNDVLIDADYFGLKFPLINNVLYIPGSSPSTGNGLYKYNAQGTAGVVLVRDLTAGTDADYIVPSEMETINNKLYFKVINSNGGVHDELWSSGGNSFNTWAVKKFKPGETTSILTKGNWGTLYFVKRDAVYGTELWKTNGYPFSTTLVSDIFKGVTSSFPSNLTAFKGKLFFSAADSKKGNELFMSDGTDKGTALVKDINTSTTSGSGPYGVAALGQDVLFSAYERVHGAELYRSDGTAQGTELLNDIETGEESSNGSGTLSKNNESYFITNIYGTKYIFSIYKSNGKKNGLQKMTPDYSLFQFALLSFNIADNGIVFYSMYNYYTGAYELWRTDGTEKGNYLLSSALYYYDYLNVAGNTAFFVAGDEVNGYELWKSDGSPEGTVMVKDINPGIGDATPGGMFVYKKEVYFGAFDGTSYNYSFWKSDGTEAGTIKLKEIDPTWGSTALTTGQFFCISNNILYFTAINYSDGKGDMLWKTNGTVSGTKPVKDINPDSDTPFPTPYYLTDVNGTVYFIADDGVHGEELWKSRGTEKSTKLVKDISPGIDPSSTFGFTNFGGRLFFVRYTDSKFLLWSSNGTEKGTKQVEDAVISNLDVYSINSAGKRLFVEGASYAYGDELYAGKFEKDNETIAWVPLSDQISLKTTSSFSAKLYPNPVGSTATLQISGNTKDVFISITDISGKKLWESVSNNAAIVNLPIEKITSGVYIIKVTSGKETQIIKFVKQ